MSAAKRQLSTLIDYPAPEVDALFELFDDPSCWMLGPTPGSWVIRVPPGPHAGPSRVTLLRLECGVSLPCQRPAGEEQVLVLRGQIRNGNGLISEEGELVAPARDTWQPPIALGPEGCVCCIVAGT